HGRDLRIENPGTSKSPPVLVAGLVSAPPGVSWSTSPEGDLRLTIPEGESPANFALWMTSTPDLPSAQTISAEPPVPDLSQWTRGGPSLWPQPVSTSIQAGTDSGPFASDVLSTPQRNPWACRVRPTGFDFLPQTGQAAVCTWDGDVWIVSGLDRPSGPLTWRRFASGLFQPLGLKVLDGKILVGCRDQIVELRDLDLDGEADHYACFNDDHQVTDHFHEFAMDLQADAHGNLYYAKAARHGLDAVVPQHGTLLKVSADGSQTEILATGFRAPNGVCLNPDGTFFLTDQEGFWTPKNRINWVRKGRFYGNMWGFSDVQDPSDDAMEPPVCWITNDFDRSPAQMLWVDSKNWGPLDGALLSLSYGNGKVFIMLRQQVGDQMQGGMVALPIPPFPTGLIRGRFHPTDGALYACGMFAWAGDRQEPGDFYRIRATGRPMRMPIGLKAIRRHLQITFTDPLDQVSATDPSNYHLRAWDLNRSAKYGSPHVNEHALKIETVRLSDDGRTVDLTVPDLAPTRGMEILYQLQSADGHAVQGAIHNTIHNLPDP
ncbi:MAG TPA: hypothetical protein VFT74_00795, partial [Isosphaeraceae bacterium]|nr:hypothetical protein [Isosphaeraceae bacterium]